VGGPGSAPERTCRCGALQQQSWWHEVLENGNYRVVRVDSVNAAADVLTISVASEPEACHPMFLTIADIDWPALLANFAEPVVTRNGERAALLVHSMLVDRLRQMLDAGRAATPAVENVV
jgi:hypothetical protein